MIDWWLVGYTNNHRTKCPPVQPPAHSLGKTKKQHDKNRPRWSPWCWRGRTCAGRPSRARARRPPSASPSWSASSSAPRPCPPRVSAVPCNAAGAPLPSPPSHLSLVHTYTHTYIHTRRPSCHASRPFIRRAGGLPDPGAGRADAPDAAEAGAVRRGRAGRLPRGGRGPEHAGAGGGAQGAARRGGVHPRAHAGPPAQLPRRPPRRPRDPGAPCLALPYRPPS